jgi:predicted transcriptional regulator YheO
MDQHQCDGQGLRPQDGIIEILCINYDITPLKETEQKLIIARDKAEELDRLKSLS